LALAYVEKGRYAEAIELFQKSIDLLVDTKEKVITMNRLGNAYRQIKDYNNAVAIYQKADSLIPPSAIYKKILHKLHKLP